MQPEEYSSITASPRQEKIQNLMLERNLYQLFLYIFFHILPKNNEVLV
jgi:hypothetical protein